MRKPFPTSGDCTTPWYRSWLGIGVIALLSAAWLGYRLEAEPAFVDEWAYFSQSFYGPLWWEGKWDRVEWLDYAAYDLPPLPKYLIALSLRLDGHPLPGPVEARAWYGDTSTTFGDLDLLLSARRPSVLFGVLGCLAAFVLGNLARGPGVGLLAAALLAINPLYRMHARRAMSDVPAEALVLVALAVGLWAWREILIGQRPVASWFALAFGAGTLSGLAVLSKLNGGLALMVLGAWGGLAVVLPGFSRKRKAALLGSLSAAGVVAFAVFLVGNPFLSARPRAAPPESRRLADQTILERTEVVLEHRVSVSRTAQNLFPHNALTSLAEKVKVVAVQGFGRFGPLGPRATDSRIRYDGSQDWGALIWGPIVACGLVWSALLGRRQLREGRPPTAWAVGLQAVVALLTVTMFIPLAWDRYLLPIQSGSALLAAGAIVAVGEWLSRRRLPIKRVEAS
ncbi:hypothetical protein BH23PLA1_BH23PLA1_04630 [soil metagenome]